MANTSFEERYKKLNPEQKRVVDTIDGPVLVIAGPGSGKTEILSLRVAQILRKTDASPGSILCLTFTDSASVNMRERLSGLIGVDAYRVQIHTFHSFGVSVINRFPEHFFGSSQFNPADTVTQIETLSQIFNELSHDNPLSSKHPEKGFVFLDSTLKAISNLKRAGINPQEFIKIIEENDRAIKKINPSIHKLLGERLSKSDLPKINKLIEDIRGMDIKKFPVTHIKSLEEVLADSLSFYLDLAQSTEKTVPISSWKTKFTELSHEGERILKDTERLPKMKALAKIYENYQKLLYEAGYYDFDDMLLETIRAIEKIPSLKSSLQEEYQYILVDEFQDTNDAQMRLLYTLTSSIFHEGRPNIMAVGDDDQAIYKFQGAEIRNIVEFKEMYRDPVIVTLLKNYRSTQDILNLAQKVMGQGVNQLKKLMPEINKQLVAHKTDSLDGKITYKIFETELHQYDFVAQEIKEKISQGIEPKDIAVIGRTHRSLQGIVPFLRSFNIPVEYEKQQNVLELSYIRELLTVAKFLNSLGRKDKEEADELLPEILSFAWWGIPRKMIWEISLLAREGKTWLRVMQESSDKKLKEISDFLINLGVISQSVPLERIMDLIIGSITLEMPDSEDDDRVGDTEDRFTLEEFESPFREYYFGKKIKEHKGEYISFLSGLRVFIETLREYKQGKVLKISDLVELLDIYEKNNMEILDTSPFMTGTNAVKLITAHKAKGLEFDAVFVISVTDDIWSGGSRGDNLPFPVNMPIKPSGDNKEDILRLFYVALTRAKHTLYLTVYEKNSKGRNVLPLEFISHLEPEAKKLTNKSHHPLLTTHSKLSIPPFEAEEKAMLTKLVENYQMSVTHLNNFLDLSKGGPKIFLEQNLLRFPQAKSVSNVYGTAMHAVMQYIYTYLRKEGKIPDISRVTQVLKKQIVSGRLSSSEERIQVERGIKALKLYYKIRKNEFNPDYKIETDFRHEGVVLNSARLTGKIDKMIIKPGEIEVIDYKTGKPKLSWNEKDIFSSVQLYNYKRQLIFYKFLIENSKNYKNYRVNKGRLEFLEPLREDFISLALDISKDDVERQSNLAKIVYEKIVNLDFSDTTKYSKDLLGTINFEDDLLMGKI